jgi:Icc-related predicted phosphoesterase
MTMKIVSFGDVHMATRNLERMGEVLRDTDLVIVSGDLTNFGGPDDARIVIGDVRRACPRVLALSGNLDLPEVISWLEDEGVALHGRGLTIDDVAIFGCGGSNRTPFSTPTEFSEDEIYEILTRGYEQVRDQRPLLMICHTPPFETKCDRIVGGRAVGSTAARRFIEEIKPDVCISGHIHESAAVDHIGPTTILNAGPFKGGGYIVVQTNPAGALDARLEFL